MAEQTYEITLKDLLINKGAATASGKVTNVLAATLFYPSAGRGEVGTIKTIPIVENQKIDFTTSSFKSRIIAKEKISGDTLIEIKITQTIELTDMEKFVVKLLHNVFGAGAKVATETILAGVTAGIGNVLLGAVLNTSIDELLKKMFDENYKQINILGECCIELSASDLQIATAITKGTTLRCPKDIVVVTNMQTGGLETYSPTQAPRDLDDDTKYTDEIAVNEGDNGFINILITPV
ncbi:hypothetical protein [Candidatus Magnetominusculus xianensis]|uniref:Uncharacterized protein n=1 Tax=Candidatus Magnetominusculus xianensis TaxID=1748249 RepID=A0ABR5SB84_9BACT|nr:hypothetical protein [Candidatus Magnetominusculus xianensis]KWT76798.1 hypothetical protein ASN18_3064 [Candidatus Magnetominusculus xianensis]MBF0402696.1 hypothetical protein [Nitrospirota bacterium]